MLRLTTLPMPNHVGVLRTFRISYQDAIRLIRECDPAIVRSHIGFIDCHQAIERAVGRSLKHEGRHMPKTKDGDVFLTVRKDLPEQSIETATWLRTVFSVGESAAA